MATDSPPLDSPSPPGRLVSVDALRGFDMFWIIGAEDIVHGLAKASDTGVAAFLATQLSHKAWEGFAFYDLIFPLFVFLAGVSIVLSLGKNVSGAGSAAAAWRIIRRSFLLYALGVLYYGGIAGGLAEVRWVGVLQRIAISYYFASWIFLLTRGRWKPIAAVAALILLAYWALLSFVPVPGTGAVSFAEGANWANYIDEQYLPGRRWDGKWDPEGILSNAPAVASCLIGVLAGLALKSGRMSCASRSGRLVLGGALLVGAGFLWGLQFPVIKKLWTSSYVLVAGGYSCMLLGAFHWVIDGLRIRFWAAPFVWIGTNALAVYLLANVVSLPRLAQRFVGGEVEAWFGPWGELVVALSGLLLALAFVAYLHRRRIYIKV